MKTIYLLLAKDVWQEAVGTLPAKQIQELIYDVDITDDDFVHVKLSFCVTTIKQLHESLEMMVPRYSLKYHTFRKRLIKVAETENLNETQICDGGYLRTIEYPHIKDMNLETYSIDK